MRATIETFEDQRNQILLLLLLDLVWKLFDRYRARRDRDVVKTLAVFFLVVDFVLAVVFQRCSILQGIVVGFMGLVPGVGDGRVMEDGFGGALGELWGRGGEGGEKDVWRR